MNYPINDPLFRVEVLSKSERPNLLSYLAMHQDYNESNVFDELDKLSELSEKELGERLVRRCIKPSHFGILEHPSITLNVIGFPHSVMVQARTHRVGISFDCQSQRYTSQRIIDSFHNDDIESVFYIRPVGDYLDRKGKKYTFTNADRKRHLDRTLTMVGDYVLDIERGFAEEHARDLLPQNIRQDFVVTFNARSLLHFCDLRLPSDAQPEIRTMAEMIFNKFKEWMPECSEWYEKNRKNKNKLAP